MTGQRVATVDKADAVQRAFRTLWQGFGTDALIAIGAGLVLLLDGGDVLSPVFWGAFGVLIIKSVLVALASYLQRLHKQPKPIEAPADPALTADYQKAVDDDSPTANGYTGTMPTITVTGPITFGESTAHVVGKGLFDDDPKLVIEGTRDTTISDDMKFTGPDHRA